MHNIYKIYFIFTTNLNNKKAKFIKWIERKRKRSVF